MKAQHHSWALLTLTEMFLRLERGPKLGDNLVQVVTPSGATVMLDSAGIRHVPDCAHRIDCSLIVPRRENA